MNKNTIINALINNATKRPNKIAFIFLLDGELKYQKITFYELYCKVIAFSKLLEGRFNKNDRILICYPWGLDYIVSFLACIKNGLIAVPIFPPDTINNNRIKKIIYDCEPKLALTSDEIIEKIVETDFETKFLGLHVSSSHKSDESAKTLFEPQSAFDSNDIALLQYTSGSTSNPKGVMITHGNMLANSDLITQNFQHDENTVSVVWLPLYHDMGLMSGIIQPTFLGMTCAIMSPISFLKRPLRWLKTISEFKDLGLITSGGPNFAYEICCNYIADEYLHELDLSNWHIAYSGAEPIRASTLRKFANKFGKCGFEYNNFYPLYGLAEATLMASAGNIKEEPVIKKFETESIKNGISIEVDENYKKGFTELVGCGTNLEGQKLLIVNPQTLCKCPENVTGEIWITGPSISKGYWEKPEINSEIFNANTKDTNEGHFLRTGDLGFLIKNELFVTGRLKELIIIGGKNYYPHDIELAVEKEYKDIREGCGAAFSIDINNEEKLVIVYEIHRKFLKNINIEDVVSSLKRVVSQNFGITVYDIVFIETSSFPKTSSGKVQRLLVKQYYLNNNLKVIKSSLHKSNQNE